MNTKIIKFILIIITGILVVIEGFYLFLFPAVVNANIKSGKFSDLFFNRTGLFLDYKNLKIKTSPLFSVSVEAENISVYLNENQKDFLSNYLKTSFWLPALLFNKLKLNYFQADGINLKLIADEKRNIFFADLPINFQMDEKIKFNADLNGINVRTSNIILVDKFVNRTNELKIEEFLFHYKKNRESGFSLKSEIYTNNKKNSDISIKYSSKLPIEKGLNNNKFKLDGYIKNLDLSDYNAYFMAICPNIKKVNGVIDTAFLNDKTLNLNASLKNFSVVMNNPLDSIISNSDIDINSNIKFIHKKIILDELNIKSTDWSVLVKGSIKNYLSNNLKSIKPDLKVVLKDADIHSLYWLAPSIKDDPQQVIQKFKKYGAWGKAAVDIQIKGSVLSPLIYGNVNLDDVYIVKNNPLVKHCKIFIELLGDKLKLKTRVFAGNDEYVDIEGVSEMAILGKGEFWVKSSNAVDLSTAEYMLVPIHEIVGFELGPVPFMKIKGKGNIDIHTKGTVLDGEVDGQFNFMDVDAVLDGLNTELKNANGSLVFDKKNMHFYTTKAKINDSLIKIDGKANLDGDINFDVISDNIDINYLLKILNTSSIVESRKHLVEPIDKISGMTSIKLKILGKVKDFSKIKENETLVIKGELGLKDIVGSVKICPFLLKKIKGIVSFDNDGWQTDLNGLIGTSKIFLNGNLHKNKALVSIKGNAIKTDDFLQMLENSNINEIKSLSKIGKTGSLIDFEGEYKSNNGISLNNFSLNNIVANGKLYSVSNLNSSDFVNKINGEFNLSKGILSLKKIRLGIYDTAIYGDLKIADVFGKKPILNGNISLNDFDLKHLNSVKKLDFLPNSLKNLLNAYQDYQGSMTITSKIKNNRLDGYIDLNNISFLHSYFKTPIIIDSGKILLNGSKVTAKSMVANIDDTPVFLNFSAWDFDKALKIDGYFTTKLTDKFANKYINSMLTYPIKPKGDITVTADINGTLDSLNFKSKLRIAPESDIYYMGANLGDLSNERELYADLNVTNNRYNLKKLDYVRYMTSQNDKSYPLTIITANGIFDKISEKNKKTFYIRNFNVQTLNNANVKIFNVLFKKSVLKNGMFNCKLNIKGNINTPIIRGNVSMSNIDMPLFDTIVKNISLKFNDKNIDISADGNVMNSDFVLSAVMKNSYSSPYIFNNVDIKSKKLNLDNFIDALTKIPTPDSSTRLIQSSSQNNLLSNVGDVQIQNGSFAVENIIIRNLEASNFKSMYSLDKNMLLDIKDLIFDVEGGKMTGSASYNFTNGKLKAAVSATNVDSNKVASNLFGVKDQIFGTSNGTIVISTNGANEEERIKNLFGNVYFEIVDGKMPKLGSVEYLLKAGNLIKSGITGASLNNFISLFAPIKTGYFSSIKGNFALKNGVAQNIEVYSKGDNLNLFINGDYDILLQYADLRVFGRLTRKAVNILGPVGNMSFNSLLNSIPGIKFDNNDRNSIVKEINKIPGVELNDKDYRIFTVKLDGHFNDEKFVKNFRWVE